MKRLDGKPRQGRLILCDKCGFEISSFFFKKHQQRCDGIGPIWRTATERRALAPKRSPYSPAGWNRGLDKTDPRIQRYVDTQRVNGEYKKRGKTLTDWLAQHPEVRKKLGGYRARSGRSKGAYRIDSFGKQTWLQSSYELRCCSLLDELEIRWERPRPLGYTLDGRRKKYFPDFWLADFGIYLDPKNDYLVVQDAAKIQAVRNQCGVRVEVLTEDHLTKEFLAGLVQWQND